MTLPTCVVCGTADLGNQLTCGHYVCVENVSCVSLHADTHDPHGFREREPGCLCYCTSLGHIYARHPGCPVHVFDGSL